MRSPRSINQLVSATGLVASFFVASCLVADDIDHESLLLFDGQTMAGWEGNTRWFRVENGALVGGSLEKTIPRNEFLCTEEKFTNFELQLEAKLVGEGNNAGVQFRSQRVPGNSEVVGYQADMGVMLNRSLWGSLYDEARRRKFLAENPEVSQAAAKPDDWNQIRIRCEGWHIQIFVNGTQTVDYIETDHSIARTGIIGLQIHSGRPAESWYRNIRLRKL